jgi:hypothetical protein
MSAVKIIKFVGAWASILLAALALAHVIVAPAEVFAVLAIALGVAPTTWA